MNQLKEGEVQGIHGAIKEALPHLPRTINAALKTAGAYRSLLKPTSVKAVTISKELRAFELDEPAYIRRIDVYGGDPEKILKGLQLDFVKIDGVSVSVPAQKVAIANEDGTQGALIRFLVKAVCTAVQVKSTVPYTALRATRFAFVGYTFDQLEDIAGKVTGVTDLTNRLDEYVAEKQKAANGYDEKRAQLETQAKELDANVTSLKAQKKQVSSEIEVARKALAQADGKKSALSTEVAAAREALDSTKNNAAQLEQTVASLNKDISQKKGELQLLVNDRNLISDEFRDYVAEGKQQSRVYEWFLYFSIAVIALCAWQLYSGAARILDANVRSYEELLTLALQRVPFATAIGLIVTVAWKLGALFVSRIMAIHAQRLGLARLLVIAKDTVYSSAAGLDVSDEQKFRERIRLKLAMLKGHMTSELGSDFDYVPLDESPGGEADLPVVKSGEDGHRVDQVDGKRD